MALEVGKSLGATAQSWNRASARSILDAMLRNKPRATKDEVYRAFLDEVKREENEYVVESIIEYWFYNNYRYLVERPQLETARKAPERVAATRAAVDAAKAKIVQAATKMVLLDMTLPHGKKLADSTGAECAKLAPKVGAWLKAIAGQIGPRDLVGKSMSEARVRKLYEAA